MYRRQWVTLAKTVLVRPSDSVFLDPHTGWGRGDHGVGSRLERTKIPLKHPARRKPVASGLPFPRPMAMSGLYDTPVEFAEPLFDLAEGPEASVTFAHKHAYDAEKTELLRSLPSRGGRTQKAEVRANLPSRRARPATAPPLSSPPAPRFLTRVSPHIKTFDQLRDDANISINDTTSAGPSAGARQGPLPRPIPEADILDNSISLLNCLLIPHVAFRTLFYFE